MYGDGELERLRFIQRLKALGLSLTQIKELNQVYAIAGSTRAMLERLQHLIDARLLELDSRISELHALRSEIVGYREHVSGRIARTRKS